MDQYNLAVVNAAVAAANPGRPAIITADSTTTYAELTARTRRLANALHQRGFGCHTERSELAGHESGQDHMAIYLHNGPEYIEAMIAAFKARVAPLNVNYRYVAEELRYLLDNSKARIVVYHDALAPTLADTEALPTPDPHKDPGYVMDAVSTIRRELNGRVPLIGFSAPSAMKHMSKPMVCEQLPTG